MLLPALTQARDRAKFTKCLNNFTQFGKAALFYAADNNDYAMPYRNGNSGNAETKAFYGAGQKSLFYPYIPMREDVILGSAYLYNSSRFVIDAHACPARDFRGLYLASKRSRIKGLGLNNHIGATKLNQCTRPSRSMYMTEPSHTASHLSHYVNASPHVVFPHFNNGVNDEEIPDEKALLFGPGSASMLFADGHVSGITRNKTPFKHKFTYSQASSFWYWRQNMATSWNDNW